MAGQSKKTSVPEVAKQANFLVGALKQLQLAGALMLDRRVRFRLKLIPLGTIVYIIVPLDLMPGLPIDDLGVLVVGTMCFISSCPPEVVDEHRLRIFSSD